MSYGRGDIVSLSRAQSSVLEVLTAPVVPDEPYTVTLPINGVGKAFTYLGTPGETVNDVASGLELILLDQQTLYSVAVDQLIPWRLAIVGPLGIDFDGVVTANLDFSIFEVAVLGDPSGRLRVIHVENTLERLYHFWTRDRDGALTGIQQLQVRELNSSRVFDVKSEEVLTVLERGT
jgi:hypothetical protein